MNTELNNENLTDELTVSVNQDALDTLPESVHDEVEGEVTVILGTAGVAAVQVRGTNTTVGMAIQAAAQRIDPSAQLVTLVDGRLTFAGGEVYLVRAGQTVTGEGLNEAVQDGDVIATGERHHNG